MRLVAAAGGVVAAMNTAEPDHAQFLAMLESASMAVISPLVVAEVPELSFQTVPAGTTHWVGCSVKAAMVSKSLS